METPDADWLDVPEVDSLFTESEQRTILRSVRDELVAGLNDVLHTWEWSTSDDADPQQHYAPLQDALTRYRVELADDAEARRSLSRALARIDLLIASGAENWMRLWRERDATEHSRSAFDDLAEE